MLERKQHEIEQVLIKYIGEFPAFLITYISLAIYITLPPVIIGAIAIDIALYIIGFGELISIIHDTPIVFFLLFVPLAWIAGAVLLVKAVDFVGFMQKQWVAFLGKHEKRKQ